MFWLSQVCAAYSVDKPCILLKFLQHIATSIFRKVEQVGYVENSGSATLRTLLLQSNNIHGSIPTFQRLNRLERLRLGHNQISGVLPRKIETHDSKTTAYISAAHIAFLFIHARQGYRAALGEQSHKWHISILNMLTA